MQHLNGARGLLDRGLQKFLELLDCLIIRMLQSVHVLQHQNGGFQLLDIEVNGRRWDEPPLIGIYCAIFLLLFCSNNKDRQPLLHQEQ